MRFVGGGGGGGIGSVSGSGFGSSDEDVGEGEDEHTGECEALSSGSSDEVDDGDALSKKFSSSMAAMAAL